MKTFDLSEYIPSPQELYTGELAYNITDDRLSLKVHSRKVVDILETRFSALYEAIKGEKVIRGENANGTWVKLADGTLLLYGSSGTTTYIGAVTNYAGTTAGDVDEREITVPLPLASTGRYIVVTQPTAHGVINIRVTNRVPLTAFTARVYGKKGTGGGFDWVAIGRWK